MRSRLAGLFLFTVVFSLIALLWSLAAVNPGLGTARAEDSTPTPTPTPEEIRLYVAGLWNIGYMGPVFGTCFESLHQSDSYPYDGLSGEISCTHAAMGSLSGVLCQPSWPACKYPLLPMSKIDAEFQNPVTVTAYANFSFDSNSSNGWWEYMSGGVPVSGTFTGTRITDHYEAPIPASSGGQLTTQLNDILTVPPGALPSDQDVTIDIHTLPSAPPEGLTPITRAYAFGPAGLGFSTPVTVVFQYTDADLAGYLDPQSLRVYIYDSATQSWGLVGGDVDTLAKTLTVELDHFSTYGILGEPLGPAPTPTPTRTPMPSPTPTRLPGVGGSVLLPPAAIAAESGAPLDDSGWSAVIWAAVAGALGATALAVAVWRVRGRRPR